MVHPFPLPAKPPGIFLHRRVAARITIGLQSIKNLGGLQRRIGLVPVLNQSPIRIHHAGTLLFDDPAMLD